MTDDRNDLDPDMFRQPEDAESKLVKSFLCPVCGAEFTTSVARCTHMVDDCADEILAALDDEAAT